MTELESRCLDAFPKWLSTLADDARALLVLVEADGSEAARGHAAGALNYLFRSLDLIPDGIEDLGFIDDAFVLRVAAARALTEAGPDADGTLARLAEDAALIREFLGDTYARLEKFAAGLDSVTARGRSVSEIVGDAQVRSDFVREVRTWTDSYHAPTFSRDEKNLVKLRSFLSAKLPA